MEYGLMKMNILAILALIMLLVVGYFSVMQELEAAACRKAGYAWIQAQCLSIKTIEVMN